MLRHQPNNAKALFRAGAARAALGQLTEARELYEKAQGLAPEDKAVARALRELRSEERAVERASRGVFGGIFGSAPPPAASADAAAGGGGLAVGSGPAAVSVVPSRATARPLWTALFEYLWQLMVGGPKLFLARHLFGLRAPTEPVPVAAKS